MLTPLTPQQFKGQLYIFICMVLVFKVLTGSLFSPQFSPLSFSPRSLCSSPTSTSSSRKPDTSPPQALCTRCSVWNRLLPESALLLHFFSSLIKYPPSANNTHIFPSLFPLCFVFLHYPYHCLTFCIFICYCPSPLLECQLQEVGLCSAHCYFPGTWNKVLATHLLGIWSQWVLPAILRDFFKDCNI